jgi:aminoglycoside 6'-N-acetyltransferase I
MSPAHLDRAPLPVVVRPAGRPDAAAWERMRTALWPGHSEYHAVDIDRFFSMPRRNPLEVLLACSGAGVPIGFVELSIRSHAEGCETDRVAFVEGWYVDSDHRNRGVGAALMRAAEEWGRASNCTELGSDTQLWNESSIAAHKALGFEEVERLVAFRKSL